MRTLPHANPHADRAAWAAPEGGRQRWRPLLAGLVLAAVVACTLAVAVVRRMPRAYRSGPGDDRPPADARYRDALQAGLATGDYPAARRAFRSLAAEKQQTSGARGRSTRPGSR